MIANSLNRKDISPLYIDITATTLLFIGCCLLQLFNLGFANWYYFLSVFVALGCGVFHVMIVNRNYATGGMEDFFRNLLLTGLVFSISVLLSIFVTLFGKFSFNFLTFQVAFVIPFFIDQAFNYFLQIPEDEYKLWYYPVDTPSADITNTESSETGKVKFVLSKEHDETKKTSFILDNTPFDTPLGRVFLNLINKSNSKKGMSHIRYSNENKELFGWLFYTKKGWLKQKNIIDPELSFRKNRIQSNEIIFAIREEHSIVSPDFIYLEQLSEN